MANDGYDVTYDFKDGCFAPITPTSIGLGAGKTKARIKNLSDEKLKLTYVVKSASKHTVPIADLDPFQHETVKIGGRSEGEFEIKGRIDIEKGGNVIGQFVAHGGCPHAANVTRGHTDWHIDC